MEYVINPLTKRPIKKGGSMYYQLLKKGVGFGGDELEIFRNKKILCEIGDRTEEELDQIKKEFNDSNEDFVAHKGRGALSKYIVKKRRKMTYDLYGLELSKRSSPKIVEFLHNIDDCMDGLEVEIARIIDKQSQILSKKYSNCSRYYILKDNFGKNDEHKEDI
jgi:hypothetical protein